VEKNPHGQVIQDYNLINVCSRGRRTNKVPDNLKKILFLQRVAL